MRRMAYLAGCTLLLLISGCDLVDPTRSTQVSDTEVFGNLLAVERADGDPAQWTVTIRGNVPRALRSAEAAQGRPTPSIEQGLMVTVSVSGDTVVIAGDAPSALDEIDPGTEMVVLPVPGSARMFGADDLRLEAQMLLDFDSYQRWRLPKLAPLMPIDDDPDRINSSGVEKAPVPVGDGTVLYFTARMRPPATDDERWHGAAREGLSAPSHGGGAVERSYRTELGEGGWSPPELVRFPGLDDAEVVRVSWVSDDETRSLLTIAEQDMAPSMALASRASASDPWQAPALLEPLGAGASDGVYLAGSRTKIVFASSESGNLLLYDPANEDGPLPLEPQINSFGREWNPRTGPEGELFFCRQDRQLALKGGRIRPLRLPGPHRILFTQAAPTDDGSWLFFCVPRLRPIEFDEDIYVARLDSELRIGPPVAVDDWRP